MINVFLSCPHHANKFSSVLTAYVIYDSFCAFKKVLIIELVYIRVSLKLAPKSKNSNLQMHTPTFFRTTMAYSHPKFSLVK